MRTMKTDVNVVHQHTLLRGHRIVIVVMAEGVTHSASAQDLSPNKER